MKTAWASLVGFTLAMIGSVVVGCGGRGSGARPAQQPEPTYQTPPLPAWSADPRSLHPGPGGDEAAAAEDQPAALGDFGAVEGEWVSEEPGKPPEPEKSVDLPPEPGQNSSTAPSDHGTVAPPQSD